jgi:hypothetical protein
MSGKHRISTPTMPRFAGTLAAGLALAVGLAAATHPAESSPAAFEPRLASASITEADIVSAMSRADALGSRIASTTFKTLTVPKTGANAGAGSGSSDDTSPHAPVTANEVIALAKKQVGVSETDGYGGGTKYQRWYAGTARAKQTVLRDGGSVGDYLDAAWCSMFISWLGHKLHFSDQLGSDAWTIAHAEWFKERGRWGHKPKAGAVVFYSWSGGSSIDDIDHVGLVIKKLGGGRIKTIEGNTNDAVTKQVRSTDQVVGYGYPDYAK